MRASLLLGLCALPFVASLAAAGDASEAVISRGETVYENYCENCHGPQLENNSGVAFDLRRLKADEHARFVSSVRNGKKGMPAWRGVLDDEKIEALWAYIRAHGD